MPFAPPHRPARAKAREVHVFAPNERGLRRIECDAVDLRYDREGSFARNRGVGVCGTGIEVADPVSEDAGGESLHFGLRVGAGGRHLGPALRQVGKKEQVGPLLVDEVTGAVDRELDVFVERSCVRRMVAAVDRRGRRALCVGDVDRRQPGGWIRVFAREIPVGHGGDPPLSARHGHLGSVRRRLAILGQFPDQCVGGLEVRVALENLSGLLDRLLGQTVAGERLRFRPGSFDRAGRTRRRSEVGPRDRDRSGATAAPRGGPTEL